MSHSLQPYGLYITCQAPLSMGFSRQEYWSCCSCCSVAQSCLTLWDPMDCSMPGFPVLPISQSLFKFMSIELVMPSNFSSSVIPFSSCRHSFPASRSFSNYSVFTSGGQSIGASASASVPSNEYSGLISFRTDWLDLLAIQGTLKSLLQHHSSKASVLRTQLSLWPQSHIHA